MTTPPSSSPPAPSSGHTPSPLPSGDQGRSRTLATVSLILGIASIVTSFYPLIGIAIAVAAIVVGILAILRIRAGKSHGRGRAIAGVATGIVGAIVTITWAIVVNQKINECEREHPEFGSERIAECVQDKLSTR